MTGGGDRPANICGRRAKSALPSVGGIWQHDKNNLRMLCALETASEHRGQRQPRQPRYQLLWISTVKQAGGLTCHPDSAAGATNAAISCGSVTRCLAATCSRSASRCSLGLSRKRHASVLPILPSPCMGHELPRRDPCVAFPCHVVFLSPLGTLDFCQCQFVALECVRWSGSRFMPTRERATCKSAIRASNQCWEHAVVAAPFLAAVVLSPPADYSVANISIWESVDEETAAGNSSLDCNNRYQTHTQRTC